MSGYGYFINEAADGTGIESILSIVEPSQISNPSKQWIRCLSHTLNLVAQALIHGEDPVSFEIIILGAEWRNNLETLWQIWRDCGFIGKLSNITTFSWRSQKQRTDFEGIEVDESGDIEWLAVQDIEDEQQLEVRNIFEKESRLLLNFLNYLLLTRLA
jgi:hypothetical protein